MVPEITVNQLAERLKGPNPPLLIDVREPYEWQICHIEGAQLKPMRRIHEWMHELDPSAEIVFQCHTGQRSMRVAMFLKSQGFTNVYNLSGGIEAWSLHVDPTVPRY